MSWRRQLPVYSPLPLRAVLAGAAGLVGGAAAARSAVERELGRLFGGQEILLLDSGTSALTSAIRHALADAPAAPVALPAYACYDIATAADGAGAPVLLYDLDPATLGPDPASLRRALERGARAVVLVHLYGVPVDPDLAGRAVRAAGSVLVEDAAQAAGASWHRRPLGSFGDLTVLSFGRGKGNTAGRGGALLAGTDRGRAVLARARGDAAAARGGFTQLAQLAAQWLLGRPSLYAVPAAIPFLRLGETLYHPPRPAAAMSAVALRALAVTLPLGQAEADVRRANASRLLARRGTRFAAVPSPAGAEPGYLRLPLRVAAGTSAGDPSAAARALGVMPGYPRALCDLEGFGERVVNRDDGFPGARALAASLVTLPTHSLLAERDFARLEAWLDRG